MLLTLTKVYFNIDLNYFLVLCYVHRVKLIVLLPDLDCTVMLWCFCLIFTFTNFDRCKCHTLSPAHFNKVPAILLISTLLFTCIIVLPKTVVNSGHLRPDPIFCALRLRTHASCSFVVCIIITWLGWCCWVLETTLVCPWWFCVLLEMVCSMLLEWYADHIVFASQSEAKLYNPCDLMATCAWQWHDWTGKWPHEGGFKKLPTGGAQNSTVCKVRSCGTVKRYNILLSGFSLLAEL